MGRNYSITDVEGWNFSKVDLPDEWAKHLGNITKGFRMLIEGPSGHGKTEYLMKLLKVLAKGYGKVNLNNVEQGKSATLKEAIMRNNMADVKGKIMICDASQRDFETWFRCLSRPNSGQIIALDSLDYMNLTDEQFKRLHERFKNKAIIIVCWNNPMDTHAKKIKYMVDVKVEVKDFTAQIRSRFGGNEPFVIWDRKVKPVYKVLCLKDTSPQPSPKERE